MKINNEGTIISADTGNDLLYSFKEKFIEKFYPAKELDRDELKYLVEEFNQLSDDMTDNLTNNHYVKPMNTIELLKTLEDEYNNGLDENEYNFKKTFIKILEFNSSILSTSTSNLSGASYGLNKFIKNKLPYIKANNLLLILKDLNANKFNNLNTYSEIVNNSFKKWNGTFVRVNEYEPYRIISLINVYSEDNEDVMNIQEDKGLINDIKEFLDEQKPTVGKANPDHVQMLGKILNKHQENLSFNETNYSEIKQIFYYGKFHLKNNKPFNIGEQSVLEETYLTTRKVEEKTTSAINEENISNENLFLYRGLIDNSRSCLLRGLLNNKARDNNNFFFVSKLESEDFDEFVLENNIRPVDYKNSNERHDQLGFFIRAVKGSEGLNSGQLIKKILPLIHVSCVKLHKAVIKKEDISPEDIRIYNDIIANKLNQIVDELNKIDHALIV